MTPSVEESVEGRRRIGFLGVDGALSSMPGPISKRDKEEGSSKMEVVVGFVAARLLPTWWMSAILELSESHGP
jgi:hypothetical protein